MYDKNFIVYISGLILVASAFFLTNLLLGGLGLILLSLAGFYFIKLSEKEQELKNEQELLTNVLDVQSELVILLDTAGRIVRFNNACEDVTGYSSEELKRMRIWDLLIEEEREDVEGFFDNLKDEKMHTEYKKK